MFDLVDKTSAIRHRDWRILTHKQSNGWTISVIDQHGREIGLGFVFQDEADGIGRAKAFIDKAQRFWSRKAF